MLSHQQWQAHLVDREDRENWYALPNDYENTYDTKDVALSESDENSAYGQKVPRKAEKKTKKAKKVNITQNQLVSQRETKEYEDEIFHQQASLQHTLHPYAYADSVPASILDVSILSGNKN